MSRGSGGVDVVHEDGRDGRPACGERTADVPAPLAGSQPPLAFSAAADPPEQRLARDLPALGEGVRQPLGRMVAALARPPAVGRYEGDDFERWPCDPCDDE